LESVIERAIITSQGTALQVLDRFDTYRKTGDVSGEDVKALAGIEQAHILQVLRKTAWRIEGPTGAAVLLGLNPSTLRARMRKYGLRRQ
jgi:transcriptional regulator of acetoin/glycerol metabolism